MALDPVQVAGVGRGRDKLDLVRFRERPDVRGPVGREVVPDPVEPLAGWVAEPDRLHVSEYVAAGAAGAHPCVEPVAVDLQGAEDVADAVHAVVGRAQSLGPSATSPAGTLDRFQADRTDLIEADHRPVERIGGRAQALRRPWARSRGPGWPSRTGGLKRQARGGQHPAEMRWGDHDPLFGQPRRAAIKRPAGQQDPLTVGGHRPPPPRADARWP